MTQIKTKPMRPAPAQEDVEGLWRLYSTEEDKKRINTHYEQPVEFFNTITGGEWNVYSCSLWDGAASLTESQERKLDLLAELMRLKPGQRILDVGCGWGGPLVYLTKHYGVRGVGLTLSALQKSYADQRIREHGAPVDVHVCHWRDFQDIEPFDAVYTDEVMAHFNDLLRYFERVRSLLKPGGVMLNKELHFTGSELMRITRGMVFVNKIFGETGNYRILHDELAQLDEAGFAVERIQQINLSNYEATLSAWISNMRENRTKLESLVGHEYFREFATYLRIARFAFHDRRMTLDIVVARSPGEPAVK